MRGARFLPLAFALTALVAPFFAGAQEKADGAKESQFRGEMVFLRDFGGDEVGYMVLPEQAPIAGIIVAPDGFGVNERFKKFCDLLGEKGYLVLGVDLFNGKQAETAEESQRMQRSLDPRVVAKALETGMNFFAKSPRYKMDDVVVLGFGESCRRASAFLVGRKDVVAVSFVDPPASFSEPELGGLLMPAQIILGQDSTLSEAGHPGKGWDWARLPANAGFWSGSGKWTPETQDEVARGVDAFFSKKVHEARETKQTNILQKLVNEIKE